VNEEKALIPKDAPEKQMLEALPGIIEQMMRPILETMGRLLQHNTEALDQLAAAQQIQNDRMEALEKQIRLNTPMTAQQVKYINEDIKARARELLFKRQIEDEKAVRKLGNAIRKAVLAWYGVGKLHEIPKHEYSVAMRLIGTWNDMMCVRDVVKEARARYETDMEGPEPSSDMDG